MAEYLQNRPVRDACSGFLLRLVIRLLPRIENQNLSPLDRILTYLLL